MENIILTYQNKNNPVTFTCLLDAEFELQRKGVQIKNLSHGVFSLSKGQKVVDGIYGCMSKAVQFCTRANSSCAEVLEEVADVLCASVKKQS